MMHNKLIVYKLSVDWAVRIYEVTKSFPSSELYGLTNQLRRAAVSITANIAEGAARNSTKEYIRFLYIALGSASESEALLTISNKAGFLGQEHDDLTYQLYRIRRGLHGLIRHLS